MTFVHKALKKRASTLETKTIIYNSEKDLVLVSLLNVKLRMAKTKKQTLYQNSALRQQPTIIHPQQASLFRSISSPRLVLYCSVRTRVKSCYALSFVFHFFRRPRSFQPKALLYSSEL